MPLLINFHLPAKIPTQRGRISMPRKLRPFVERWRDRHGKVRLYFRLGKGARTPLPAPIGSDEFNAAYQAALSGETTPARERHTRAAPGTIAALVASYKRSAGYLAVRDTTRKGYTSRIEMLRTKHGHRTV